MHICFYSRRLAIVKIDWLQFVPRHYCLLIHIVLQCLHSAILLFKAVAQIPNPIANVGQESQVVRVRSCRKAYVLLLQVTPNCGRLR
jgi:hypothetical protein